MGPQERGVGFRSLTEQIDTITGAGSSSSTSSPPAEFSGTVIRERTQAGLACRARARGRRGGHPRATALNNARKVALAQRLYEDKGNTIDDICGTLHVSRDALSVHPGRWSGDVSDRHRHAR